MKARPEQSRELVELGLVEVVAVLRAARFRSWTCERDVQEAAWRVLQAAGCILEWEARLSPTCRVDLLAGKVAVEVKIAGSLGSVAAQVARYAETGLVDGVVLLTRNAASASPVV